MKRRDLLSGLFLPFFARAGDAGRPKQVYLIRHGEKSGDKSDIHLNPRGVERAASLPKLFSGRFAPPQVLFASHQSAHSNREVETIRPLAQALHLPIDDSFADEDYPRLARRLLTDYPGKTILVCWHHGNLPAFAAALGVKHPPSPWPENQFDRLWRVSFGASGAVMEDLAEHMLAGDS